MARSTLIEGGNEGLVEEIRKEDSLWYRVGRHARASVVAKGLSVQPLYHTEAFVFRFTLAASRIMRARPKGELERLAVRRRAAMQYRLAGASYRSIAEKLTEDRANAYADANGIGLPITMCPLSQMMSERRMKPQASSPRAATGRLRLPIQT